MRDPFADLESMPLEYNKIISGKEMNADWDTLRVENGKLRQQILDLHELVDVLLAEKGDLEGQLEGRDD